MTDLDQRDIYQW